MRDVVLAYFAEDGWTLADAADGHTWASTVEGDNGRWMTIIQIYDDRGVFAFYSVVPVSPPSGRIDAVVEYVTRANAGMVTGNFEVDLDTGEVRYKTAIDLSDVPAADLESGSVIRALVGDLAYSNVATTDRYLPGLLQVVAGSSAPTAAIAAIEAAPA